MYGEIGADLVPPARQAETLNNSFSMFRPNSCKKLNVWLGRRKVSVSKETEIDFKGTPPHADLVGFRVNGYKN